MIFKDFLSWNLVTKFSAKLEISSDLLENVHTSQFEGAQNKTDLGILIFFIQNLNLGKLVAKLNYCWI